MNHIPDFDGSQVNEAVLDGFAPLPDGDYEVLITEVDYLPTKFDPTSKMYHFKFEVVSGPHTGRKIFENFMHIHPSEKAVEMGMAKLKKICLATLGQPGFKGSSVGQMMRVSFIVTMKSSEKDGKRQSSLIDAKPKGNPSLGSAQAKQQAAYGANLSDFAPGHNGF